MTAEAQTSSRQRTGSSAYEFLQIDRVRWANPTHGEPLAEMVGTELGRRSAQRPLIVTSRSLRRVSPVIDELVEALGGRSAVRVFDGTEPHVPRPTVLACVDAIREADADVVVTVGGGTPIDTVKTALLALSAGIVDDAGFDRYAVRTEADGTRIVPSSPPPALRQIVVPTTLSGAEFSDLAGCVDPATRVKQLFTAPYIGSAAVVLDPALTVATPDELWFSTGIRALDHAVESLCSTAPNPFTDATAVHAVQMLARSLRRTTQVRDDLAARLESQQAVWLACTGLNRVPWGGSHGIAHQIGAVAAVPHGFCSCIMLPHVMAYNEIATTQQQHQLRAVLGAELGDATGAELSAAELVARLVADLGLPSRLRDVGVSRAQLPQIAELSVSNMFVRQNPRPLDSATILGLLEGAF
ncbi:iron-containing alcohol dehydrogenase [Rhodococcus pyridinivorans]|uniref:iron-containing alcohol dehydrogenase n=1 Tax=Rhodococcus TaxID=1827 RepID=UPI001C7D99D2|nr:iron-containing alcohol dehydrogenase [Rhodococcus sp. DMU2021]MBX4171489.1 iron-containing alcohol dehydrogenase [Rhodococcus sp. DMU2021]